MNNRFLFGPLFDEAGDNGGGGGGANNGQDQKPLDAAAIAKMIADSNAALLAQFKKDQSEDQKKRDAAEQSRKEQEESARRAAEEAKQREEEEKRAQAGTADQKTQYDLEKLKRELAEERKKREASEADAAKQRGEMAEKDRLSAIRSALGGYQWGLKGSHLAFKAVKDDIKRNDDGAFVGPNGAPLVDYLNDLTRPGGDLEGLLAPRQSGGSGASPSQGGGSGAVDIDSIAPGKDNTAARAQIARMAQDLMLGRR